MEDNILEFPVEAIFPLRKMASSDRVIAGYFDDQGVFQVYIGKMSYMEKLFALDTIEKLVSGKQEDQV